MCTLGNSLHRSTQKRIKLFINVENGRQQLGEFYVRLGHIDVYAAMFLHITSQQIFYKLKTSKTDQQQWKLLEAEMGWDQQLRGKLLAWWFILYHSFILCSNDCYSDIGGGKDEIQVMFLTMFQIQTECNWNFCMGCYSFLKIGH